MIAAAWICLLAPLGGLLAITLVTGILVDDAIVEIENIVRHMRMGKSPYRAALEAADEIGLAVDDDDEGIEDLEAAEGLVDEHVADLVGGYEARRGAAREDARGARARLDAEAAEDENA